MFLSFCCSRCASGLYQVVIWSAPTERRRERNKGAIPIFQQLHLGCLEVTTASLSVGISIFSQALFLSGLEVFLVPSSNYAEYQSNIGCFETWLRHFARRYHRPARSVSAATAAWKIGYFLIIRTRSDVLFSKPTHLPRASDHGADRFSHILVFALRT